MRIQSRDSMIYSFEFLVIKRKIGQKLVVHSFDFHHFNSSHLLLKKFNYKQTKSSHRPIFMRNIYG